MLKYIIVTIIAIGLLSYFGKLDDVVGGISKGVSKTKEVVSTLK